MILVVEPHSAMPAQQDRKIESYASLSSSSQSASVMFEVGIPLGPRIAYWFGTASQTNIHLDQNPSRIDHPQSISRRVWVTASVGGVEEGEIP
jgi:hypothetical protein